MGCLLFNDVVMLVGVAVVAILGHRFYMMSSDLLRPSVKVLTHFLMCIYVEVNGVLCLKGLCQQEFKSKSSSFKWPPVYLSKVVDSLGVCF